MVLPANESAVETLAPTAGGLPVAVARPAVNAGPPPEVAAAPLIAPGATPAAPTAGPLLDGTSRAAAPKASPSAKAHDGVAGSDKRRPTGSRKVLSPAKDGARRRKVAASSSVKAVPARPRRSAPAPGESPSLCVPPYTVDAAGIRRVKPGCL